MGTVRPPSRFCQRKGRSFLRLLLVAAIGLVAGTAAAEPWLSTRYAQNCAGCHAPGRKNKGPMDRRCTLSCQGCHVNPNGGGLRSQYGKWNEDRWLRSFRSDALAGTKPSAPIWEQRYGKEPWHKSDKDKKEIEERGRVRFKDKERLKAREKIKVENKKKKLKAARQGWTLVESDQVSADEDKFRQDEDNLQWILSNPDDNNAEYYYNIPKGDPWRQMGETKTDGGGDVRWQMTNYADADGKVEFERFFMSADLALRWRPIYRNLHVVYEGRFQGTPADDVNWETKLQAATTRSLYVMADDLPWNVFVMGGHYRPLFGNYIPDHYNVAQEMTSFGMTGDSRNYNLLFNAFSAGTAPNVPYANIHVIQKRLGDPEDRTRGAAANLGLRFVTLGASVNYSIWGTRDKREDGTDIKVEMHSIGAAAKLGPVTAGLDAVSIKRDVKDQDLRQGGVWCLDTYTRLWRENYFTLMYAKTNVLANLMPGEIVQLKSGFRSFLIQGVDVMMLYQNRHEAHLDPKTDEYSNFQMQGYEGQLHVFF